MENRGDLYLQLVHYIKRKFINIPNIDLLAYDIVNQGYEKFIKSKKYGHENENFGYLSVICSRIALDFYKHEKEKNNFLCEFPYEQLDGLIGDAGMDERILKNERSDMLSNFLKTLSETEQTVIRLRYYNELSFSEISSDTGININTVLSHHRRALQKLRTQYVLYFQKEEKVEYKNLMDISDSVFLKYFR